MKVYCVCPMCDDWYYGYLAPEAIFGNYEDAKKYIMSTYGSENFSIEERKTERVINRTVEFLPVSPDWEGEVICAIIEYEIEKVVKD